MKQRWWFIIIIELIKKCCVICDNEINPNKDYFCFNHLTKNNEESNSTVYRFNIYLCDECLKRLKAFFEQKQIIRKNGISDSLRRKLYKERCTCPYCGTTIDQNNRCIDHVVPMSKGGRTEINNLIACCKKCNVEKSNLTLYKWLAKIEGSCKYSSQKQCNYNKIKILKIKEFIRRYENNGKNENNQSGC